MRKNILAIFLSGVIACIWACGCVQVRAPERIQIGSDPPPEHIESTRIPPTASHEEARAELRKAYRQIAYLEHENDRLREKLDECEDHREALEDRYDD